MRFIECDGMILQGFRSRITGETCTQEEMAEVVQKAKNRADANQIAFSRWRYERGHNHRHARMSASDRDHVRQEAEMAEELATELGDAYPARNFVVCHIPCYAVSFYQAVDDAPTQSKPLSNHDKAETQGCVTCQRQRPYRLLPHPDPDFPQIRWGACLVCGGDIALTEDEIRLLVIAVRDAS